MAGQWLHRRKFKSTDIFWSSASLEVRHRSRHAAGDDRVVSSPLRIVAYMHRCYIREGFTRISAHDESAAIKLERHSVGVVMIIGSALDHIHQPGFRVGAITLEIASGKFKCTASWPRIAGRLLSRKGWQKTQQAQVSGSRPAVSFFRDQLVQ